MVLAGLLIVLVTIQAWEADLEDAQSAYLAEAALTLQAQFESQHALRPIGSAKPPAILEQLRRRYGFSALEVTGPVGIWRAGKPDRAQATHTQAISVHKPDGTDWRVPGLSILYYAGDGLFCYSHDMLNMTHIGQTMRAMGWKPPAGFNLPPRDPNRDVSLPAAWAHLNLRSARDGGSERLRRRRWMRCGTTLASTVSAM